MINAFNKILLIQTAFLGDVVLATSIVEKLFTYYPSAAIDVLIKKENRSLLFNNPKIRQVLFFDKNKKFSELFRLTREIRKNKYDLVVNLHRFASSGFLSMISGARLRVGFKKNPFSFSYTQSFGHEISKVGKLHETERNQKLIENFTDQLPVKPKLYFSTEDLEVVSKYISGKYICVAPASVWFTKQFPEERWVTLLNQLPEKVKVYLLGGPGDEALAQRIMHQTINKNVVVLAGQISLLQSALLMRDALLSYVNDSAPLHLASAVNAPVCAVFCSTVPAFGFGPLSDFSRIVEIDYALECRPCNLHGFRACPLKHFKCSKDIHLSKMTDALEAAASFRQKS